eukprot:TRINITY_DN57492_c0_g1_i1.p1 TRINITY_DN57492_c0_g1~~TRINITY_DN57492_c0_g1_i1.p1  ORF type:complete len:180 (+),score=12.69 TRINITY_DN57492_c0_g1_i1:69-542(+)
MFPTMLAARHSFTTGLGASWRMASGANRGMTIASASPSEGGKHVDISFADRTAFRIPTATIKTSHSNSAGSDFDRFMPSLQEVSKFTAEQVERAEDGSKLLIRFRIFSENAVAELYSATALYALAPYVGTPLCDGQTGGTVTVVPPSPKEDLPRAHA